jgi:hypothetical protein
MMIFTPKKIFLKKGKTHPEKENGVDYLSMPFVKLFLNLSEFQQFLPIKATVFI